MSSDSAADPEPNAVLMSTDASGITTITINRPHRRNAVNTPTAYKLYSAFRAFEADPAQKIAILTGANGTFCSGFDLHEVASRNTESSSSSSPSPTASAHTAAVASPSSPNATSLNPPGPVSGQNRGPMGPTRLHLSKPLIAAVAGYAVAGGLELSLLADLRVVENDAVLGVFCRRWGVPLIDGGTVRLQAIVGLGRALDLVLTGRAVHADEAERMGLANRVVGKGLALEEARRLARELLAFPQACMRADRMGVYYSAYEAKGVEDALGREFELGSTVLQNESVQGAKRFSGGAGRHGKFGSEKL